MASDLFHLSRIGTQGLQVLGFAWHISALNPDNFEGATEIMLSLLYVSRSLLAPDRQDRQLADIVSTAASRNLAARVTGALIHTPSNFAQVLEGPEAAVEEIMGSILVDPRHRDVSIVGRTTSFERRFPNWAMVLVDRDSATQRRIDLLWAGGTEASFQAGVEGLIRSMEFSASPRLPA